MGMERVDSMNMASYTQGNPNQNQPRQTEQFSPGEFMPHGQMPQRQKGPVYIPYKKKNNISLVIVTILAVIGWLFWVIEISAYSQLGKEYSQLNDDNTQLQEEYDTLKEEHNILQGEYSNLLESINSEDTDGSTGDRESQGLDKSDKDAEQAAEEAKIQGILSNPAENYEIADIISKYKEGGAAYDILNDKHIKVTGYVKSTYIDSGEAIVYLDAANMQSFFGSKLVFTEDTDNTKIAELKDGDKIVVDGIGDTTGATFSMYHCYLVSVDLGDAGVTNASGEAFHEEDYAQLNIEDVRREPSEYEGSMVWFTGEITQVMPLSLTNWHERYIVDVNGERVSFYSDSDTKYLEGDEVTVYGVVKGTITLENLLGASQTAPDIKATLVQQ